MDTADAPKSSIHIRDRHFIWFQLNLNGMHESSNCEANDYYVRNVITSLRLHSYRNFLGTKPQ